MNGAVVGEFKAPNKFKYYDKGILMDEPERPSGESLVQQCNQNSNESPNELNEVQLQAEVDSSV